MRTGMQGAKDLIAAIKTAHPKKDAQRNQLADAINILQVKAYALDQQAAQAHADFAASKGAQFTTFTDELPDVGDPVP